MKIPKVTLIIWTSNYYSSAYKQEVQAVRVNIDRFEGIFLNSIAIYFIWKEKGSMHSISNTP